LLFSFEFCPLFEVFEFFAEFFELLFSFEFCVCARVK